MHDGQSSTVQCLLGIYPIHRFVNEHVYLLFGTSRCGTPACWHCRDSDAEGPFVVRGNTLDGRRFVQAGAPRGR